MKRALLAASAAASLVLFGTAAQAESYVFGTLFAGNGGPAVANIATLTATQVGDDINFSLVANGLDLFGPDSFLGAIAMGVNPPPATVPTLVAITNVVGDAPVSLSAGGGPSGAFVGRWDLTGPQQARLTDDESVSWTWTVSNPTIPLSSYFFAAHIQAVSNGSADDSLWYVPGVVPEPGTYALMLAGLFAVGVTARRRRN